jgi:spore maturation protein CgeB
MRFAYFAHSILSDWNNGNAHFQRGVLRELVHAGHDVHAFEPVDGWSRTNLIRERGDHFTDRFKAHFPELSMSNYELACLDIDGGRFKLFFHDTHHRSATDPDAMSVYDLEGYDGVLAFGEAVRQNYLKRGWSRRVWTWHEAADTRLFRPIAADERSGEVVWIGNWGDEERTQRAAASSRRLRLKPTGPR